MIVFVEGRGKRDLRYRPLSLSPHIIVTSLFIAGDWSIKYNNILVSGFRHSLYDLYEVSGGKPSRLLLQ